MFKLFIYKDSDFCILKSIYYSIIENVLINDLIILAVSRTPSKDHNDL